MALPFLPEANIVPIFQRLRVQATTPPLQQPVQYVADTWVFTTMWPPSCWSIFMVPVRTNNDIEGWHHSINRRANGKTQIPFYLLVDLLHQEARLVTIQIRFISEGKLSRIQRRKYRMLQARLFTHWDEFSNNEISALRLLKLCSYMNGPRS